MDRVFPDSHQQVLPVTRDLMHEFAREIDGREFRNPDVAARQHRTTDRLVEVLRGAVDGVSLGHPLSPTDAQELSHAVVTLEVSSRILPLTTLPRQGFR